MAVMKIAMFLMNGDVGQQPKAEVKIRSNLPAITLEEAIPDTATDATLLAPQEVQGNNINLITSFPILSVLPKQYIEVNPLLLLCHCLFFSKPLSLGGYCSTVQYKYFGIPSVHSHSISHIPVCMSAVARIGT